MDLAHREPPGLTPAVLFAESGIVIFVGMLDEIFPMKGLERDAGLLPFGMDVREVG